MRTLQCSFIAGAGTAVALGLAACTSHAQVLTDVSDIKISVGGSEVECQVILPHGKADTLVVTSIRVDTGVNTWVSLDAGLTWRKLASAVSGSVDPIVASSPHVTDGRLLLSHLEQSTGAVSVEYKGLGSAGLDSATAFTHVTVQAPEVREGFEIERGWDKNFLWVDRRTSGSYAQRVYCGYSDAESNDEPDVPLERVYLKYSTDHGASWSSRKNIDLASTDTLIHVGLNLATAPDAARIYAAWAGREASPDQPAQSLWFRYSTGGGDTNTWTAPTGGAEIMSLQGFDRHSLHGKSMRATVSPSMVVAGDGDIYIAFADKQTNHHDTDIFILKSDDGGANWKVPGGSSVGYKRVNASGTGPAQDQWFPWITWDDATNSLAVVYYDSRDDTLNVHTYMSVSRNEGVDWTDLRVSDTPWDGDPPESAFGDDWAGDYIGVVAADGVAFPVWCDDRLVSNSYRLYTSPVLVGGIKSDSIAVNVTSVCGGSGVRFEVDWPTAVAMSGYDKLTVTPPGGSALKDSVSSSGRQHELVLENVSCPNPANGASWSYVVESRKGAAVSRTGTLSVTVPQVSQSSVTHSDIEALVDSIQVTITWDTDIATQTGGDAVKFYTAVSGGTLITPVSASYTTSNGGLTHVAVCKITPCAAQSYYYYEVRSTLPGATALSARSTSKRFKLAACLE